MSENNRQQLAWILDGLHDPDQLLRLGHSGVSASFGIKVDPAALDSLNQPGADPALTGAALVIRRFDELWDGVNDEMLWQLMLSDLFGLVIGEWETEQREQGPWKLVFDAHLLLGKQRGWLKRLPTFSHTFGKSTAELARLNARLTAGQSPGHGLGHSVAAFVGGLSARRSRGRGHATRA